LPAGGPTDKVARDLAEVLRKGLNNQTVVIENVGGAGGTLGAAKVAKAAPDGYTLLLHHIGMATSPALYRNLPYKDAGRLRVPGHGQRSADDLIGKPSLPATQLRRAVASGSRPTRARSTWPMPAWAPPRTCAACCSSRAMKIDMTTVPYKGTAPAMTDLLGGQVDIMCDQTTNTTARSLPARSRPSP
jgi:tripartite-type tricarboxylate transporter receptor subunit TctC